MVSSPSEVKLTPISDHRFTGFPRTLDRALLFEKQICKPLYLFVLDASIDTLKRRLTDRGREDDQSAALEKRVETWEKESEDVKKYYFRKDPCKLVTIDSNRSKEDIAAHLDREMIVFCHNAGIDLLDGQPFYLLEGMRFQNLNTYFGDSDDGE